MSIISRLPFQVILLCLLILLGCEQNEIKTVKPPPNLAGIKPGSVSLEGDDVESGRSATNGLVDADLRMFAFQGDDLYRINPYDRTVQWAGNNWGGTQGATIAAHLIYAVRQDHLWR